MKRLLPIVLAAWPILAAAQTKLSELPAVTSADSADIVPVVASGVTSKITLGNFALSLPTLNASNLTTGTVATARLHSSLQAIIGNTGTLSLSAITLTLPSDVTRLGALISLATEVDGTLPWASLGSTPTTLAGYGIADAQPLDSDLSTWATKTAPSGTVVGTSDTQTLTNKTLARPTIANAAETQQTLTDGATIAWDMDVGGVAKVTLGGNRTISAPTNTRNGATYILEVIQDATGSRTLTWDAAFVWPAGSAPTLTTTANKRDFLTFICSGGKLHGAAATNFQ